MAVVGRANMRKTQHPFLTLHSTVTLTPHTIYRVIGVFAGIVLGGAFEIWFLFCISTLTWNDRMVCYGLFWPTSPMTFNDTFAALSNAANGAFVSFISRTVLAWTLIEPEHVAGTHDGTDPALWIFACEDSSETRETCIYEPVQRLNRQSS